MIEVLNIVGGLHLDGVGLEQEGNSAFRGVVELLLQGQYDAAGEVCKNFPKCFQRAEV